MSHHPPPLRIILAFVAALSLGCESTGSADPPPEAEAEKSRNDEAGAQEQTTGTAAPSAQIDEPASSGATGNDENTATPPTLGIRNAAVVSSDVVAAGQPTRAQISRLPENDFDTVVNLRTDGELEWDEEAAVEMGGLRYVHIPIGGADDLTEENAKALDDAIESAEGRVLVHCASSNRVGALFALRAAHVDDVDPDEALELGLRAGLTRLEDAVRTQLNIERSAN